ncbi:MAG: alpha-galactosidase [Bacteroidales bacterium]|nr:alpha-galactosidase [Bacteroidales bacterium]
MTHTRILVLTALVFLMAVPSASARKEKKKPYEHTVVEIPAVRKQVIAVNTSKTQLVLRVQENGVLQTLHYGALIRDPEAFLDFSTYRSDDNGSGPMAYPTAGGRYVGEPALHVRYADGYHNTELYYTGHEVHDKGNVITTEIRLKDYVTLLEVKLVYDAYQKEDVIVTHTEILNGGKQAVELQNYASGSLYLDAEKYYLTHFHGGWADEMQMDGELLTHDTKVIESRRGTQVTQCNNPSFLVSLNADRLEERTGEVVAGALAWSGNFRLSFEMDESGRLNVLSGISPDASAYRLSSGQTFVTPDFIYTFSQRGAGQASRNLHAWARNYGVYQGGQVNPTLLNSWEGAYFTFTTETLLRMIDDAASMGLEMFVLDDGWFAKDYPRNGTTPASATGKSIRPRFRKALIMWPLMPMTRD